MVEQLFRLAGFLVFHTRDARRSEPGFLDLVMVKSPRVIFAELKVKDRRPSTRRRRSTKRDLPTQEDWFENLRGCPGVETYLWKPEDWDEIGTCANQNQQEVRIMAQLVQDGAVWGPVEDCAGCAAMDAEALADGRVLLKPGDDPDDPRFCPEPTCNESSLCFSCEDWLWWQRASERREAREIAASQAT